MPSIWRWATYMYRDGHLRYVKEKITNDLKIVRINLKNGSFYGKDFSEIFIKNNRFFYRTNYILQNELYFRTNFLKNNDFFLLKEQTKKMKKNNQFENERIHFFND